MKKLLIGIGVVTLGSRALIDVRKGFVAARDLALQFDMVTVRDGEVA